MPIRIRKADVDDAEAIARVQVDTWRTTYHEIVPREYLTNMSYDRSRQLWERVLLDAKNQWSVYVAEDDSKKVAGFVSCGPNRDNDPTYRGETYAVYVLQEVQMQGIGSELMLAACKSLRNLGFNSMIVWVLTENPSRRFYEKLGGIRVQTRSITVGGKLVEDYGYSWNDLRSLANTLESKEKQERLEAIQVREISPEDYPGVNSIARSLNPTWFTESALEEIANALRSDRGFVAMQYGMHVGFGTYRLDDENENAQLTWIGVRPDFQRKGVGRRLLETIQQELGSRGIHRLEVFTVAATVDYEPYDLTRRFYYAMGFSEVSVEPKGFPSGDDKLLLRKQLDHK